MLIKKNICANNTWPINKNTWYDQNADKYKKLARKPIVGVKKFENIKYIRIIETKFANDPRKIVAKSFFWFLNNFKTIKSNNVQYSLH